MRVLMIVLCVLFVVSCNQQSRNVQKQQDSPKQGIVKNSTPSKEQMTIYEDGKHRIYIEKEDDEVYCYADGQKVVFHDDYLDEGAMAMFFHCPANCRYIYIVGDIVPNSNGWTVEFHLYRIDKRTFAVKHIGNFAGIRFESNGFMAATTRLLNPDAECTADERYAIRDLFFDYNGRLVRKGKNEYRDGFSEKYGEGLINADGFPYGS